MTPKTRTCEEIYEEIRALVNAALAAVASPTYWTDAVENAVQEAALWGEISELAIHDSDTPLWAASAAGRAQIHCLDRADQMREGGRRELEREERWARDEQR